jgi:large-conductance mechanosensitive channel
MWAMSGYVIATYKHLGQLASAYYTLVPAVVMIFIGIVFLLGAISGLCGAIRESRPCSLTFFLFVFLIFALLITAIVLSFVYKREVNDIVEKESAKALNKYGQPKENTTTDQVNWLHQHFRCCGSYNYTAWYTTPWGANQTDHFVPVSCCKNESAPLSCFYGNVTAMGPTPSAYIYDIGCVHEVEKFLKSNLYYLGAGAIAFLVLLILGMIGSCFVLWKRKENSYFNLSYERTVTTN